MGNAGYGNHTEDTKKNVDSKRTDSQAGNMESPEKNKSDGAPPAAGPHDKSSLTNTESTPGAGVLPDVGDRDATDSTSS